MGSRFRVCCPGSWPQLVCRAGPAARSTGQNRAPGTTLAAPPPCAVPGPPRPGPRRPWSPSATTRCSRFPAVPLPPRAELAGDPGRYRALPRRNHLYLGRRFASCWCCAAGAGAGSGVGSGPGLGSEGGLGGTGDRPGRPGLGQRRRRERPGAVARATGIPNPRGRGPWRWGVVSRLQPPPHPRPGPCYLRGSDGEGPGATTQGGGAVCWAPKIGGRGTLAGSWRPMTDERRGGRERRTVGLKGDAGAAGGAGSLGLFNPLWQPSCGGTNCVHR